MRSRVAQPLLVVVALVPVAGLAVGAYRDALGANPIEAITHATGDWALRFLLASLAITPLRRLSGWNPLIAYRRTLGLLAFAYAALHVATFVALDHWFDWTAVLADVRKRPYVTAGALGFACLVPLAATSTRGWIRRLGRRWTTLHRLAYVAAAAAVLHYWWLVKADVRAPFWYGVVLAALLLARAVPAGARRRRAATGERRLDPAPAIWCIEPMHGRHKKLIVVGLVVFLLGWLAWSVLLTESELEEPVQVQQGG